MDESASSTRDIKMKIWPKSMLLQTEISFSGQNAGQNAKPKL